jgi:hypothetical protein
MRDPPMSARGHSHRFVGIRCSRRDVPISDSCTAANSYSNQLAGSGEPAWPGKTRPNILEASEPMNERRKLY